MLHAPLYVGLTGPQGEGGECQLVPPPPHNGTSTSLYSLILHLIYQTGNHVNCRIIFNICNDIAFLCVQCVYCNNIIVNNIVLNPSLAGGRDGVHVGWPNREIKYSVELKTWWPALHQV
jgi:hypothetical protein